MKLFETPELELIKFAVEDVITTSTVDDEEPPMIENVGNCI